MKIDSVLFHCHCCFWIVHVMKICWNRQQQCVEESTTNDTHEENSDVVTKFVSKESDNRWSDKDTEWKYGVHEGNVHIIDTDILHVNGEVWHDGKGGAIEEEQGELEREQFHVEMRPGEVEHVGASPVGVVG